MDFWRRPAIVLALLIGACGPAPAWPDQPVRIVVPFAAGGTTDVITRVLAQRLTGRLGQPVVVENVGGAGGNNGATVVAKSAPDGTTILMATPGPAAMNQFMYARMPYDTASAFVPIVSVATNASVLIVSRKVAATNVTELVALMKGNPGRFNYGSAGNGSTGHLAGTMFTSAAGVTAQHVPYRGSAPMLQDLIAGNLQFTIDSAPGVMSFIQSGTLRALAVTTRTRSAQLPDLPTMAEAGLPDVEMSSWVVLMAPAGTPRAAIDRINAEVNTVLQDADVRARIVELGANPEGGSPEDLGAFIARETARWKRVVEIAGVRLD
jgi:tripartite-type tricarboxylate transporter receptor subunit TctC